MNQLNFRKLTGGLFILGVILVNIPYALLISTFEYPDILRQPTDQILTQFAAGGAGLIAQWLAFAWLSVPILAAMLMLPRALGRDESLLVKAATQMGVIAALAQIIGLLRWVFVVPILARLYNDPATSPASQEAVIVVFQTLHQSGGVLLGEHIGQLLTIAWMSLISLALLKSDVSGIWLGWFGFAAALVYLTAQTELFATVIPGFPVVPEAGLIGSLLWLGWMLMLGVSLVRARPIPALTLTQRQTVL